MMSRNSEKTYVSLPMRSGLMDCRVKPGNDGLNNRPQFGHAGLRDIPTRFIRYKAPMSLRALTALLFAFALGAAPALAAPEDAPPPKKKPAVTRHVKKWTTPPGVRTPAQIEREEFKEWRRDRRFAAAPQRAARLLLLLLEPVLLQRPLRQRSLRRPLRPVLDADADRRGVELRAVVFLD